MLFIYYLYLLNYFVEIIILNRIKRSVSKINLLKLNKPKVNWISDFEV